VAFDFAGVGRETLDRHRRVDAGLHVALRTRLALEGARRGGRADAVVAIAEWVVRSAAIAMHGGVDPTGVAAASGTARATVHVVAGTERNQDDDKPGSDHHELLKGDGTLVS